AEAIVEVLEMSPPQGRGHTPLARSNTIVVLTPREEEVLHLLADGLRDREIAERLFISARTVEGHVTRILAKLDVPTRASAVRAAIQLGLMDLDRQDPP
ncbi:MAG TPA: response regulator transcription factor, partial [Thermomicrobiales bacterium]|nr:response regulator transcription factor [Thermomicrobiales bacterium]